MAASRSRLLAASTLNFLRVLWRVTRQVFHETVGALFFFFSVFGGTAAWRQWQRGTALWAAALASGFTVMMFLLGVSSFRSARRVR